MALPVLPAPPRVQIVSHAVPETPKLLGVGKRAGAWSRRFGVAANRA